MVSKQNRTKSGHLFKVEILLEEFSNGLALEKLLQTLNSIEIIKDYNITSGIELGKLIELNHKPIPSIDKSPVAPASKTWVERVENFKNSNSLIRLYIVQAKGLNFNIPCRIVHCSPQEESLTVYHVDEKKVYTFSFNEIEDMTNS